MARPRPPLRRKRRTRRGPHRGSRQRRPPRRTGPHLQISGSRSMNPTSTPISTFHSGFVSIVGRPNAGKSTLLNALVGQKVAIVADKPQTTRTSIQGVVTLPDAQIVFVDTPGIHKADSPLNRLLMHTVRGAMEERDLLLFVADASHKVGGDDKRAIDLARKPGAPVALVLNKVDLLRDKSALLPLIEQYKAEFEFAEYVPVSAKKGTGLDELRKVILQHLPEGPQYFPEDYVT